MARPIAVISFRQRRRQLASSGNSARRAGNSSPSRSRRRRVALRVRVPNISRIAVLRYQLDFVIDVSFAVARRSCGVSSDSYGVALCQARGASLE